MTYREFCKRNPLQMDKYGRYGWDIKYPFVYSNKQQAGRSRKLRYRYQQIKAS